MVRSNGRRLWETNPVGAKEGHDKVEEGIGKQANAGFMSMFSDPKQLYTREFASVFATKVLPLLRRIANTTDRGTMQIELDSWPSPWPPIGPIAAPFRPSWPS